ncbi:hypothetical protein PHYPSEUDO_009808 [Phytophthora pseudosyringae]|uniref:Uncharacterized protein n=1 Tax=Phytophthora pseudosyringae TaxID=221518 RepID=A0A8T1VEN6_9STRA|nr:hypothetical protein PHYPSEUDO_009808 [Phytophthora pseudosyringae]
MGARCGGLIGHAKWRRYIVYLAKVGDKHRHGPSAADNWHGRTAQDNINRAVQRRQHTVLPSLPASQFLLEPLRRHHHGIGRCELGASPRSLAHATALRPTVKRKGFTRDARRGPVNLFRCRPALLPLPPPYDAIIALETTWPRSPKFRCENQCIGSGPTSYAVRGECSQQSVGAMRLQTARPSALAQRSERPSVAIPLHWQSRELQHQHKQCCWLPLIEREVRRWNCQSSPQIVDDERRRGVLAGPLHRTKALLSQVLHAGGIQSGLHAEARFAFAPSFAAGPRTDVRLRLRERNKRKLRRCSIRCRAALNRRIRRNCACFYHISPPF